MIKTINDFKQVVLNSQDKNELYLQEIELVEYAGSLHKSLKLSDSDMETSEIISNLKTTESLLRICQERQEETGNFANRVNYNFRMAAKSVLTKETYQKIWELAQLTRNDVKDKKKELNQNKVNN